MTHPTFLNLHIMNLYLGPLLAVVNGLTLKCPLNLPQKVRVRALRFHPEGQFPCKSQTLGSRGTWCESLLCFQEIVTY